jgi:hypothetical protein
MSVATVSVELPEPLYRRLQSAATVAQRSLEEVLASTVAVALPPSPDLPEALANELAEMIWLSDDALRAATKPDFSPSQQERLAELNDLADDRALSPGEETERAELLAAYEWAILRRAQAFQILARRGHRIPTYPELASTFAP